MHKVVELTNLAFKLKTMKIGDKIKQIRKDKGLQQKQVAIDLGLDQSNYNKIENGKREPSLEVLQKLSTILDISIDDLVNAEDTSKPTAVTMEDKTISEKIRLMEQLEDEDKNVIYRMLDTMLTKQRFQNFFEQNLQTAK